MKRKLFNFTLFLCMAVFLTGCGSSGSKDPTQPTNGYYQTGKASWYGGEYHGRPTASGEIFDKNALTAAHRTLAFGTWVEVNNLENGYRVTVRINDRGPTIDSRIIDLSERAADELGMKIAGLADVTLDIVAGP